MFLSAFIKPRIVRPTVQKTAGSCPMDRGVDLPIKFACIFHSFPLVCECAYACVGGGGLGLLLWVRSKDLKCQADLSKVRLSDIWTSTEGCRSGYIWSRCA